MSEQASELKYKAAMENMREAIVRLVAATPDESYPGVLTDFVVVAAIQNYDADGEVETAIGWYTPDGQACHRTLGIVDYMHARMRHNLTIADE